MKIVNCSYQERFDKLVKLANGNKALVQAALKQVNPTDAVILEPTVDKVVEYIKANMQKRK